MPAGGPRDSGGGGQEALLAALRACLGDAGVLDHPEDLRPFECDGLSMLRELPLCVVLPGSREEVQDVLRLCAAHGAAVVPRGAGTGLSGGARPVSGAVLLNLARMRRMEPVDRENASVRLEPGVRNLAISEAARPLGFYYAPDPSSQIACTIGGNVAENSGGVHCLKYGLTVHNLLALDVVTAGGEFLRLGEGSLDQPGYDLLALLTGSEGLLGVIAGCTVRLLPLPEARAVLLATFAGVEEAARAVGEILAAGVIPAGLEMMDHFAIGAAEDFVQAGYPRDAGALLLCELDGTAAELAEQQAEVVRVLETCGAVHLRIAEDAATQAQLWKGRKAAFPAVGRISPDYYCMDGSIPRRKLGAVLREIALCSQQYGLRVANVFHAGDGNLHPLILYDASQPGERDRAEQFGQRILELCVAAGGSVTGEHGVGVEKLDGMCVQFTADELAQLHAIRAAFDPGGRLNPGKAVPSLHRCAELGAMHVHQGALPFPEMERY